MYQGINHRLILIDSSINENTDIIYDEESGNIICNQLYRNSIKNSIIFITKITVSCNAKKNITSNLTTKYIMKSNKKQFVNYLTPIYVELIGSMEYILQ